MAVKDTAQYLPACLDSIINQSYPNWELIAVNDHSSDKSLEVLEKYRHQDQRIHVFNSDKPKLIPTLQIGHSKCKGDLINRMDSDDKMPSDKLEVLVNEWLKYGKGHVIAGGTQHFVDEGEVGGGFLRYEQWLNDVAKNNKHVEEIYTECVIPSHSWIIHKDDFNRAGAFNPIVYPEDYDLCFRFYREELKIIGINHVLHYWRDRSDRISRTWEEYKDNRYFDLKTKYFFELDRQIKRPLVLWGAGQNGKDLAKRFLQHEKKIHWICDNPNKIGKDVYGITMEHFESIVNIQDPQIVIAVASPDGKAEIREQLAAWGKLPVKDFWFFC